MKIYVTVWKNAHQTNADQTLCYFKTEQLARDLEQELYDAAKKLCLPLPEVNVHQIEVREE